MALNNLGKPNDKKVLEFINEISKLEIAEFMGLAKILCISLFNEDSDKETNDVNNFRDFAEVVSDMIDSFVASPRQRRRQLMKIIKTANGKRGA